MKKILKKLLFVPLTLLLCSFTPRMGTYGTVGLTLYSYSEYTSSGSTSSGIGHSFVALENNTSWPLDLGFYTLPPFGKCTLGLWGNDNINDYTGDISIEACADGIFYNREAYAFTHNYGNPSDMVKLYREVDSGQFISRISNFRGNQNYLQYNAEQYSLIGYNCSNFAAEFFAISTQMDFGPILSPQALCGKMNDFGASPAVAQEEIFQTNNFWRYLNDGTRIDYPN